MGYVQPHIRLEFHQCIGLVVINATKVSNSMIIFVSLSHWNTYLVKSGDKRGVAT